MHVIERTEKFTLIGSDARRGKLTLFAAEGPRERGALQARGAAGRTTSGRRERREAEAPDGVFVDVSEGLVSRLVEAPTEVDYDLDHVALYSAIPPETAQAYLDLGFRLRRTGADGAPRVEAGGAFVEFHSGRSRSSERPLLNHLAVLVDSAEEHLARRDELGSRDRRRRRRREHVGASSSGAPSA